MAEEQALVSNVPATDDAAEFLEPTLTNNIVEDEAKAEHEREPNSPSQHAESQSISAPAAQPEAPAASADQAEQVVANTLKESAPAPKPPQNPLSTYQSSAQAPPLNPLSRYSSRGSPLGAYNL